MKTQTNCFKYYVTFAWALTVFLKPVIADTAEFTSFDASRHPKMGLAKAGNLEWTPERMRNAKDITSLNGFLKATSGSGKSMPQQTSNTTGKPYVVEPSLPDKTLTQGRLIAPSTQATKITGKLFFETWGGDATCTASVVTAPSNRLVVTAAHCVFDLSTKTWYWNLIFVPAYDDGAAPLGQWAAKNYYALNAYLLSSDSSPNYNYDVGFIIMHPLNSRLLAAITGSYGISFNSPRNQLTFSFGYPANIADSEIMSACISRATIPYCAQRGYSGQGLRCGMTQGSSGGPWLINFTPSTGVGYVNSVNSFGCDAYPYVMHGPYFDSNILSFYNAVKSRV